MSNRYLIADCPRCHTLIIADSRYKSKTCPKCNNRIQIEQLKVIQSARDSREARIILSEAKTRRGSLEPKVI